MTEPPTACGAQAVGGSANAPDHRAVPDDPSMSSAPPPTPRLPAGSVLVLQIFELLFEFFERIKEWLPPMRTRTTWTFSTTSLIRSIIRRNSLLWRTSRSWSSVPRTIKIPLTPGGAAGPATPISKFSMAFFFSRPSKYSRVGEDPQGTPLTPLPDPVRNDEHSYVSHSFSSSSAWLLPQVEQPTDYPPWRPRSAAI